MKGKLMTKEELIEILEKRFIANMHRHKDRKWDDIKNFLTDDKSLLDRLMWMEESGGQPGLVSLEYGTLIYVDMSEESPKERNIYSPTYRGE